MTTNESRWGLLIIAVVALFATAVVAIKVLAPNAGLQNARNERLDRIERQLSVLLEQDRRMTGGTDKLGNMGGGVAQSTEMAERIENLEALLLDATQRPDEDLDEQINTRANQRLDELEERLLLAEEKRKASEEEEQVRKIRTQKITSASNDPILRSKYFDFLEHRKNERHNMIAETFENDVVDPQWAQERMNQITTTFTSPVLTNATLLSADCRTSMCRVAFTVSQFDENDPQFFENELLAAFSDTLGDTHSNMKRVTNNDGNTEYNMYIFRNSAAVPKSNNPFSSMSVDDAVEYLNANY